MTTSPQEGKSPASIDAERMQTLAASPPKPSPWLAALSRRLPAYALVLFFALLQAFYNLQHGFWEGEETTRALLALAMRTGDIHWFAPFLDGTIQPVSWMEMLLLSLGGPNEFLLRVPFLGFSLLSLLVLAEVMVQHTGRWTSAFAVALAGGTPLLLFGGTALHGYAGVVAPISIATLLMAHYSAKREVFPIARGLVMGVAFGASYLAWGVLGAAIPVATGLLLSWTRGTVAPTVRTLLTSSLIAVMIVAIPTFPLIAGVGLEAALPYIFWPPLVGDASPQSFDELIRRIAFSTFPLPAFLPFSVAWLSSRMKDEENDFHSRSTLFTLGLLVAASTTFAVVGVAHVLRPAPVAPMALIFAALAALSVSGSWRKNLRRSASYLTLMTSALLLLLMARDLRGNFSAEEGRPGPYVFLEPLLSSSEGFSEQYTLAGLFYLALSIVLLLFIGYADIPSRIRDLKQLLGGERKRQQRLYRWLQWWHLRSRQLVLQFSVSRIAVGIGLLMVLQAVLITQRYLPEYSSLVSDHGLRTQVNTLRQDEEALYVLDEDATRTRFYLRGMDATPITNLAVLEKQFCTSDARVFAVLTLEQSQDFYAMLRRARQRAAACPRGGSLHVLDDSSSHLVLVSNELHEDRGEKSSSILQRAILPSSTALPPDLQAPEQPLVVGGAIEYLGVTLSPARLRVRGDVTIRSYWRIRRSPSTDWSLMTHLDTRGDRINADHLPFEGKLSLSRLLPGDIFVDEHTVRLMVPSERAGTYHVYLGFFHGETRMEVEPPVPFHRIPAGSIELRGFF